MKEKTYYYVLGIVGVLILTSLPLIFEVLAAPESATIYIYKGWNIISSPFEESLTLSKIAQQCDLTTYKGKIWAWTYDPANGWTQPTGVKKDEGVYILSEENCTVTLTGTPAVFSSRTLKRGWNLISAEKSFEEIKGDCQVPYGYKIWTLNPQTQQWFNPAPTDKLDQSKGYWVAVENNCTLSKSVVKKYTNPPGIVLVKKDSDVEKIADEIADERNYVLLPIENSDPVVIRNKIKETVGEYPTIKYLLIIGADAQIPLEDRWNIIKHEGTGWGEGAVLDSLFYGNIDEDIFVEIGVGRIPFNDENDVENYFENLDATGSKNYYTYYPVYRDREISESEKSPGVCLSKEFSNTQVFVEPSKESFVSLLKNGLIIGINSHGLPASWELKNDSFEKSDVPDLSKTRPLIISNACLSAQELGPEFLKKNAGAFIGEYFVSGDFSVDRFLVLSKEIFRGNTLGQSLKNYLNYGIAKATVNKKFAQSSESPIAVMDADNSVIADHTVVLLGDPGMTIQSLSSPLGEITIKKQNNKIIVGIPKPVIETINNAYVVGCYGGKYETNQIGWFKEHWDLIAAGQTLKWTIGEFVFPAEDINTIKGGKEIIAGKEFSLETVRLPFASLVKGNDERYIVIEETLTVDSSVFSNSREIILEF